MIELPSAFYASMQTFLFECVLICVWMFVAAERRIRVHTLCLPVTSSLSDVQASANQLAIVGLLAKMGELFLCIYMLRKIQLMSSTYHAVISVQFLRVADC